MTDNTPDNYLGPLTNLGAILTTLATQSDDVKHIATNLGVAWALPWLAVAALTCGTMAGLSWLYRRAVGRGKPWALWLQSKMPWSAA